MAPKKKTKAAAKKAIKTVKAMKAAPLKAMKVAKAGTPVMKVP